MPTMRSRSPSRYSVSTVSSVRQTIRLGGNITPSPSPLARRGRFRLLLVPSGSQFQNVGGSWFRLNTGSRDELFDRYKDRMPDFALDVLRQVALAGGVLDQNHLSDTDDPALAVAGGYLHPGIEIDDVLSARRRMPVDIVLGLRLAEDDTRGR